LREDLLEGTAGRGVSLIDEQEGVFEPPLVGELSALLS
jgi:hypothetical protein